MIRHILAVIAVVCTFIYSYLYGPLGAWLNSSVPGTKIPIILGTFFMSLMVGVLVEFIALGIDFKSSKFERSKK